MGKTETDYSGSALGRNSLGSHGSKANEVCTFKLSVRFFITVIDY